MSCPKAVIVSVSLPSSARNDGGGSVFVEHLVGTLTANGWQTTMLTPQASPPPTSIEHTWIRPVLRTWDYLWGLKGEFDPADRLFDLAEIERAQRDATLLIFVDRPVPTQYPTPTVLIIQAVAYWEVLSAVLTNHQDVIWTPSQYAASTIRHMIGACCQPDCTPVEVVPPPVEFMPMDAPATTEHSPHKNLRLTSPHRLDWAKGHLDTLALISKLREEGVTAHLYIPARSHKREARLLHRAQELEVDDLVHIHGWVSREQMPAYLSSMDWTLSLGEIPEAFGLSVAESLVCATPTLARPIGAVSELATYGHALVLANDANRWAESLLAEQPTPEQRTAHAHAISRQFAPAAFRTRVNALLPTVAITPRKAPHPEACSCTPPWTTSPEHAEGNDFRRWSRLQENGF